MANQALITFFLFLSTFSFCQISGVFSSRKNMIDVIVREDNTIKFLYFNFGHKDSVSGNYKIEDKILNIDFSFYDYQLEQVKCTNKNCGMFVEDDAFCIFTKVKANDVSFSTNYIEFNSISRQAQNDTTNLKITFDCREINFEEHFTVNRSQCYRLLVKFNPTSFDFKRFSEIYIKNKRVIVVDGVKYYLQKKRKRVNKLN